MRSGRQRRSRRALAGSPDGPVPGGAGEGLGDVEPRRRRRRRRRRAARSARWRRWVTSRQKSSAGPVTRCGGVVRAPTSRARPSGRSARRGTARPARAGRGPGRRSRGCARRCARRGAAGRWRLASTPSASATSCPCAQVSMSRAVAIEVGAHRRPEPRQLRRRRARRPARRPGRRGRPARSRAARPAALRPARRRRRRRSRRSGRAPARARPGTRRRRWRRASTTSSVQARWAIWWAIVQPGGGGRRAPTRAPAAARRARRGRRLSARRSARTAVEVGHAVEPGTAGRINQDACLFLRRRECRRTHRSPGRGVAEYEGQRHPRPRRHLGPSRLAVDRRTGSVFSSPTCARPRRRSCEPIVIAEYSRIVLARLIGADAARQPGCPRRGWPMPAFVAAIGRRAPAASPRQRAHRGDHDQVAGAGRRKICMRPRTAASAATKLVMRGLHRLASKRAGSDRRALADRPALTIIRSHPACSKGFPTRRPHHGRPRRAAHQDVRSRAPRGVVPQLLQSVQARAHRRGRALGSECRAGIERRQNVPERASALSCRTASASSALDGSARPACARCWAVRSMAAREVDPGLVGRAGTPPYASSPSRCDQSGPGRNGRRPRSEPFVTVALSVPSRVCSSSSRVGTVACRSAVSALPATRSCSRAGPPAARRTASDGRRRLATGGCSMGCQPTGHARRGRRARQ